MSKRENIAGQRFGYLVAAEFAGVDKNGHAIWMCKCDCGNEKLALTHKLKNKQVMSCGCMQHKYSHGQTNTRLYHIWRTMKARCLDPGSHKYSSYGGRGITICDEWADSFEAFRAWALANGYADDLSIDRENNDGNYCPENCRWATSVTQANNTRRNRRISHNGETHTVAEWSRITGLSKSALCHRLERGWSVDKALLTPSTGR